MRKHLSNTHRWVVKIGSALLTDEGRGLDHQAIKSWVAQMANLRKQGIEIIMVSSGAVAEGMARMGWTSRPSTVYKLQAAAAIGQMGMVQTYESFFQAHDLHTAQILLTHDDLSNRERYLNARSTLCTLLELGVIPIINENDTVTTDEIRFGDNDSLAGLVSNLIQADVLLILTDQEGLFTADPRHDPHAKLIQQGIAGAAEFESMAGDTKGALGRGGMQTKLTAAKLAARSGTCTLIASGHVDNVICRLYQGENIGTCLQSQDPPLTARKRWLASHLRIKGQLKLDAGAVNAIQNGGNSLLPVGVVGVEGDFQRGESVACLNPDGQTIARGLVNYNASEAVKILRCPSNQIQQRLGYADAPELIHRDNLVLL